MDLDFRLTKSHFTPLLLIFHESHILKGLPVQNYIFLLGKVLPRLDYQLLFAHICTHTLAHFLTSSTSN